LRRAVRHDEKENGMSKKTTGCRKPKSLKDDPKECTPQQVKKCHGNAKGHVCAQSKRGK
jgi:hypothetical protein